MIVRSDARSNVKVSSEVIDFLKFICEVKCDVTVMNSSIQVVTNALGQIFDVAIESVILHLLETGFCTVKYIFCLNLFDFIKILSLISVYTRY